MVYYIQNGSSHPQNDLLDDYNFIQFFKTAILSNKFHVWE